MKIFQSLGLLMLAILGIATANAQQQYSLRGIVVDTSQEPLIGATVMVKGTAIGTATDIDGKFTISVKDNDVIQVSYVGYDSQSIRIHGQNDIKVELVDNSTELDNLVVVGYGTQKKENLTGSVASISSKDIASVPTSNTAALLQGRLPGVVLTSQGGQAGYDTPEIRIRGVGTLSGNNDPMVLIDGVESSISQFAQLSPSDIDNISVLKDAASASIYGVRAANGVILVTTKRGAGDNKTSVVYNGSFSLQEATRLPDYMNAYDWALLYNEANGRELYTSDMLDAIRTGSDPDHFADTNWAKEIFRTAPMTQHSLTISGGINDTHYMFAIGYLNQEGILRNTDFRRYNFRTNVDTKLKRFTFGINLAGSYEDKGDPGNEVTGENGLMRMLSWFTRPTVPVRFSNGEYAYTDGTTLSQSIFKNPLFSLYDGYNKNNGYRFDGKFWTEIDIYGGLKFRTSAAYKLYINDTSSYSPKSARYDAEGNKLSENTVNSLSNYRWTDHTFLNENILYFDRTIAEKHNLNVLAGFSIQSYRYDWDSQYRQGFATDNLYEMNAGTVNDKVGGSAEEWSLESFFGRINYNYDSRYLFEFNIRHDGSSRMPKSHRFATFPSVSAGWVISNERFMEPAIPYLSTLKLRASWGKLGNQEIGNYSYSPTMAASYNYYFGNDKNIGMAENIVANDDIRWETTAMTDIGVDAGFFNNRINLTFDWFNKVTSDILLKVPMPTTFLGTLPAPYKNAGKVQNRGWELAVNYIDGRGDWTWSAGFSVSQVDNKIIDNKGIDVISGSSINREGYPIWSYYGLNALGIYRTQEDLDRTDSEGRVVTINGAAPQLGDVMYEDVDGNGNIDSNDRIIIGNPFPDYSYSVNLGLRWKNLDFSALFQGVAGMYRYNWSQTTLTTGGNMTTRWLDRWTESNVDASMPRIGNEYNSTYSSFWLEKADYFRLKNIELGYTFGSIPKLGVEGIRLYLQATNLFTITSYHDYDPEKSTGDARADVHPNVKSYSIGVNVRF